MPLGILSVISIPYIDFFIYMHSCVWQEENVVQFLLTRRFDEKSWFSQIDS